MFNGKLRSELEELKTQVYGPKKKEEPSVSSSIDYRFYYTSLYRSFFRTTPPTLKEFVDSLKAQLEAEQQERQSLQHRFDLLLTHLKLEYHKITDENGTKTVNEVYQKLKKQKKTKEPSCYRCDEWED